MFTKKGLFLREKTKSSTMKTNFPLKRNRKSFEFNYLITKKTCCTVLYRKRLFFNFKNRRNQHYLNMFQERAVRTSVYILLTVLSKNNETQRLPSFYSILINYDWFISMCYTERKLRFRVTSRYFFLVIYFELTRKILINSEITVETSFKAINSIRQTTLSINK